MHDPVKQISSTDILENLPPRDPNTHKGDYGRILLLCGCKGYTGAPALAAMGALRCGAGLVYMGVPESIYMVEAIKLNEPVIYSLPEHDGKLSLDALDKIKTLLPRMDAVLIGCGLGTGKEVTGFVSALLHCCMCPVVLDADGINCLEGNIHILRDRAYPTILTPHIGEFQKMGYHAGKDPVQSAMKAAKELSAIVLLKGHRSVITDGKTVYVNPTGNPGMACGGSGDVLAGIITSLLGQGLSPLKAAAIGAWLHGAAGDLCAEKMGQYGMLPTDLIQTLPRLLP